jgi:hypothetical protein
MIQAKDKSIIDWKEGGGARTRRESEGGTKT